MSQTDATTEAHEDDERHGAPVKVTITITDQDGASETREVSIPSGPTKVPKLKAELDVPAEASLWVTRREGGKPKHLVDHATHNVKAGDMFSTVVKGGVS